MSYSVAVLLHNIRSSHNVGSIFRTCDGAGVSQIFLSGYTPRPIDKFGRAQKDIAKTALGAEQAIPWQYRSTPQKIISKLKQNGWNIVGVEQDQKSIDYHQLQMTGNTLFIFGNEVNGISRQLRETCDVIIEIPMCGKKESLNVSVTAGIVLFATNRNPSHLRASDHRA